MNESGNCDTVKIKNLSVTSIRHIKMIDMQRNQHTNFIIIIAMHDLYY